MGEVYRAHDGKLGRDVALKTLPREFALDARRLARLRREAQTLASLNHPNIATIHGLEQTEDATYLVLELVEGETLRGPMPIDKVLEYSRQLADGVQAAQVTRVRGLFHSRIAQWVTMLSATNRSNRTNPSAAARLGKILVATAPDRCPGATRLGELSGGQGRRHSQRGGGGCRRCPRQRLSDR